MCSLRSVLIVIVGLPASAPWLAMLVWPGPAPGQTAAVPPPSRPPFQQPVDAARLERLIRQLGSESFEEREAASKVLDAIGAPAMPALWKARQSADREVRHRAAALLKSIARKRSRARAEARVALNKHGNGVSTEDGTPDGPTKSVGFDPALSAGDAEAALLPFFNDARYLCIRFARMSDDGLANIETFYRLEGLSLAETKTMTDAGLQHVGKVVTLESLDLGSTRVTDAGLLHLKNLKKLVSLDLSGTRITDAGLEHLKQFKELRLLHLGWTQVTDAGMEHLKEIKTLTSLHLDRTHITDAGLDKLKSLKRLECLSLSKTQITDAGLAHLRDTQALYLLHVDGTKVTERGKAEWIKRANKHYKEIEDYNKAKEAAAKQKRGTK